MSESQPVSDYHHLPRIRVGESFARRTPEGNLVETGYVDDDGVEVLDRDFVSGKVKIDPSNPAAVVPWNQKWE